MTFPVVCDMTPCILVYWYLYVVIIQNTIYHHASQSILVQGTLRKATELTEEPITVHNKSYIKLNTSICLSFVYITCQISTANLMIDNLIVSPDTSTLRRLLFTWLQNQEASGLKQRLIVCMLWVSNVDTRILIRLYMPRTSAIMHFRPLEPQTTLCGTQFD